MSGSIADLTRAVGARTGFTATFVEQRGRQLQGAGLLPVAQGRTHIAAKPRHLAHLLLSLASAKVRNAPAVVNEYAGLATLSEDKTRAGDALEQLVRIIWDGDRQARGTKIAIVETEPKIFISSDGYETHFYPTSEIVENRGTIEVRRTLEIPCIVIAQIGADLGYTRCNNAL